MNPSDLLKINALKIKELRWILLRLIDASRPIKLSENVLRKALSDERNSLSTSEIRRELDYLQQSNLVNIDSNKNPWLICLTATGIDVVSYVTAAPEGIDRPELE